MSRKSTAIFGSWQYTLWIACVIKFSEKENRKVLCNAILILLFGVSLKLFENIHTPKRVISWWAKPQKEWDNAINVWLDDNKKNQSHPLNAFYSVHMHIFENPFAYQISHIVWFSMPYLAVYCATLEIPVCRWWWYDNFFLLNVLLYAIWM